MADGNRADVEVDAVGVEIQAGDLGVVVFLHLIGGPAGMEELHIEDAVIDEEILDRRDLSLYQRGGPGFENGIDVPADFFEEFSVAEGGVAVADEDEISVVEGQEGAEFEISAEFFQGGGGGDDLEVTGGDEGSRGVQLIDGDGAPIAEADDVDADIGAAKQFVANDGVDFAGEIGAGDDGQNEDQGS